MPFCSKCGGKISADAQFCYHCGKSLVQEKQLAGLQRPEPEQVNVQPVAVLAQPVMQVPPVATPVEPTAQKAPVPIVLQEEAVPSVAAALPQEVVAPVNAGTKKPANKKRRLALIAGVALLAVVIAAVVLFAIPGKKSPKKEVYVTSASMPQYAMETKDGWMFLLEEGRTIKLQQDAVAAVITADRKHIVTLAQDGQLTVMDDSQTVVTTVATDMKDLIGYASLNDNMHQYGQKSGLLSDGHVRYTADGVTYRLRFDSKTSMEIPDVPGMFSHSDANPGAAFLDSDGNDLLVIPANSDTPKKIASFHELLAAETSPDGNIVSWADGEGESVQMYVSVFGKTHKLGSGRYMAPWLVSISKDEEIALMAVNDNQKNVVYLLRKGENPVELGEMYVQTAHDGASTRYAVYTEDGCMEWENADQIQTIWWEGVDAKDNLYLYSYSLADGKLLSHRGYTLMDIHNGTILYQRDKMLCCAKLDGSKLTEEKELSVSYDYENYGEGNLHSIEVLRAKLSANGKYVYYSTREIQRKDGVSSDETIYYCYQIGTSNPKEIFTNTEPYDRNWLDVSEDGKTVYFVANGITDLDYLLGADPETYDKLFGYRVYCWHVGDKEATLVHEKVGEILILPIVDSNGIIYCPAMDMFSYDSQYDQGWYYYNGKTSKKLADLKE